MGKRIKVTAIFDIGKTNKKFFLFDCSLKECHRTYTYIDPVKDEDGYPTEDLNALVQWMRQCLQEIVTSEKYRVTKINFSTYGASLVYIDADGNAIAPLYNYTKPYPKEVLKAFKKKYGKQRPFLQTGAPESGFLQTGLQLFWFKKQYPKRFKKLAYVLHLPQYLSALFSGLYCSEYTSIGCHTLLWDFKKEDWHQWLKKEKLLDYLPKRLPADTTVVRKLNGQKFRIGVGVHDSSAALVPYLHMAKAPFVLISTGTWSITLNPFNSQLLTNQDLALDTLYYLRVDGKPVRATRLFLGQAYSQTVKKLNKQFKKKRSQHKKIKPDKRLLNKWIGKKRNYFDLEKWIPSHESPNTGLDLFDSFEDAYHCLMVELMQIQAEYVRQAIGKSKIKTLFVDGGFTDNPLFNGLLAHHFPGYSIRSTKQPLGSALGAAILVQKKPVSASLLKANYGMKKHRPKILTS